MLSKAFVVAFLAVSLLVQGLPLGFCRCCLARSAEASSESETAIPTCPHCVGGCGRKVSDARGVASHGAGGVEFDVPCCGCDSTCTCCGTQSRSNSAVTTSLETGFERPAVYALVPNDPLADVFGMAFDGDLLAAVPDVPPKRPVRILLGVWRN